MNKIDTPELKDWETILKRPTQTVEDIETTVIDIFKEVKLKGDAAVAKYTSIFDGITLSSTIVSSQEIDKAIEVLDQEVKDAVALAKDNIEKFHKAQQTERIIIETTPGVSCWQEKRPIQKVGRLCCALHLQKMDLYILLLSMLHSYVE